MRVAAVAALARHWPRTRTSSAVFAAGPAQCCVEGGRFTCTRGATLGGRLMAGKSLGKPTARLVGRWAGGREPIQFATTSRGLRVRPGTPLRGCGGSSSPSSSPLFSKRLTRPECPDVFGVVASAEAKSQRGQGVARAGRTACVLFPPRFRVWVPHAGTAWLRCCVTQASQGAKCTVGVHVAAVLLERPSEGPRLRREPPKVFRAAQTTAHRGAP